MQRGADLAIEEINSAGGVLGRQLALVIRDNEHKLDRGVAQTRELIEREGCAAILGSQGSFIGLAVIDTIHELKVPWFALAVGRRRHYREQAQAELHVPRGDERPRGREIPRQLRLRTRPARKKLRYPQRGHRAGACRPSPTCRRRSRARNLEPASVDKMKVGDSDFTPQMLRAKNAGPIPF